MDGEVNTEPTLDGPTSEATPTPTTPEAPAGQPQADGENQRELTFGEKAVGLTFNPGNDEKVHEVKALYAKVIDLCNELRTEAGQGEKGRLLSVAITEAQAAQMWAVKGITWRD